MQNTINAFSNITNCFRLFDCCYAMTGNPKCGSKVVDMTSMYDACKNITGSPVCGANVQYMTNTYSMCINLTGSPVCGANVTDMSGAYSECYNLTGAPVCGAKVNDMTRTYASCHNITGSPVCGANVINMVGTYSGCNKLTGSPVCGAKVVDMWQAYEDCTNITGEPVCGANVTDMGYAYFNCRNLVNKPVCGSKVQYFQYAYGSCSNLIGYFVCGPNVTSMSNSYSYCSKLAGAPVCGTYVTNMTGAYTGCTTMKGPAVCGNNVTNMRSTYAFCYNLIGSPVCGPNVTDMAYAYDGCYNLTGAPVCGTYVTNMCNAYNNCVNLTGNFAIPVNVVNISNTYNNCRKLKGKIFLDYYVENISGAFRNCKNMYRNVYIDSYRIYNVRNCFRDIGTDKRTNIYVLSAASSSITNLTISNTYSLVGSTLTWTNNGSCYYNTSYNLYIYPVSNVDSKYIENEIATLYDVACYNTAFLPVSVTSSSGANYSSYSVTNTDVGVMDPNSWSYTKNSFRSVGKDNNSSHRITHLSFNGKAVSKIYTLSESITSLYNSFASCRPLVGDPWCGPNVTNMSRAYYYCENLNGAPVCGNKVTNMYEAYSICSNLTGQPVCGPNVVNMSSAYTYCENITGTPVCGPNVTNMYEAYYGCYNIKGAPVCGNNVVDFHSAYASAVNITGGTFTIGPNVTDMGYAFHNCYELKGNCYIFSNKITAADQCFGQRNTSSEINVFVPSGSTTLTTMLGTGTDTSIATYSELTWTQSGSNYYNSYYNIRICPVANVVQTYKQMRFEELSSSTSYLYAYQTYTKLKMRLHNFSNEIEVKLIKSSESGSKVSLYRYSWDVISETEKDLIIEIYTGGTAGTSKFYFQVINNGTTYTTRTYTYEVVTYTPWKVESVSGASYGFSLNNDGYYESLNKGVSASCAICKVYINNPSGKRVYIDVINNGEYHWSGDGDFGLISKFDTTLALDNTVDDDSLLLASYPYDHSNDIKTVDCGTGSGYIYIKYRKNNYTDEGNDSLQFTVRMS